MWLLTIEEMQCECSLIEENSVDTLTFDLDVQCEWGAVEPKSLLILRYEGQSIKVQA
jgi:hypothetical protein